QVCIFVEPDKTFQTFLGIGGAITDASAEVYAKLSPEKQTQLMEAYFDKNEGNAYTVIRTNMNSCDFSSDMYTYVSDGDKDLMSFNIEHDKKFKIPMIKQAVKLAPDSKLYFSPWSPPAYMKSNKNMLKGGALLPEYFDTWARYYVKFIESYKKEGLDFWGLTIQNEPMATQIWESCIYTAEEERDFLKDHLGPTLAKNGLGNKKIIIWDHNRDLITQRVNTILEDKKAAQYVWGVGFHWYENWTGGNMMFDNVGEVNLLYPEKNLIFTEGCADSYHPDRLHSWTNAEKYGRSMINDFNKGTVAWTDWNILLDETGGPNHVGNFCFAPVHADLRTGELVFTPSYYYIGHFSKFVKEGAKRVSCVSSRSHLLTTSFINPDGKLITIVMNPTDKAIKYNLCVGIQAAEINIPARAIQTIVL
ncbi:MAG TPA: glycoside hydrolase family 30 protein, partial [Saprospiraceae bacterium]|nr:glycoside hydrolase family 30 protein [Saprospiraceae bacterium]